MQMLQSCTGTLKYIQGKISVVLVVVVVVVVVVFLWVLLLQFLAVSTSLFCQYLWHYLWHHNCAKQEQHMADVFLEVPCGDSVTMLLLLLFLADATFLRC
jgi:Flp pilus assembly protein TadB